MKDFKTPKYLWCALILSAVTAMHAWGQFAPSGLTSSVTALTEGDYVDTGIVFTVSFTAGQEPLAGDVIRFYAPFIGNFYSYTVTTGGLGSYNITVSDEEYTLPATSGTYNLSVTARVYRVPVESGDSPATPNITLYLDPTLTTVTIAKTGPTHPGQTATQGTIITVSFTASEAIDPPTATINGQAAAIAGAGRTWQAEYTINEAIAGGSNSPIGFVISNIQDLAGNPAANVNAVTDASIVRGYNTLTSANTGNPATPTNWTPNAAPTQYDDLIVLAAHAMTQASQIDCYSLVNGGIWDTNGQNYSGTLTNNGTFIRRGAGVVNGGVSSLGGTIEYTGGATATIVGVNTYNNLTINTATIGINDDLTVGGQLQVLAGSLSVTGAGNNLTVTGTTTNNGTLNVAAAANFTGLVTNTGTITGGTAATQFINGLTQTGTGLVTTGGGGISVLAVGVDINGSGGISTTSAGTISITGGLRWGGAGSGNVTCANGISVNGNVTWAGTSSGGITATGGGLTLTGTGNITQTAAANGPISVTGTLSMTGTLTNHDTISASAALTVSGAGLNTNAGTITGGSGLLSFAGSLTSTGILNVGAGGLRVIGTADFSGGTINGYVTGNPTWEMQGSVSFLGLTTLNQLNDILLFTGGNAQTFQPGGMTFGPIQINKTNTIQAMDTITASSLNIIAGTLDLQTYNLTVNGITSGAGTIRASGLATQTIDCNGAVTMGAIDFTGSSANFSVTGDMNIASFTCGTSTLTLDGAVNQTVTTNAQTFNVISIASRAAGTVSFTGALNVADHIDAAGAGTYAVAIPGGGYAANLSTFSNAGNLNLPAGFNFRGGLTHSTGNTNLGGTLASWNAPIILTDATPRTLTLAAGASINTVNAGTGGDITLGTVSNAASQTLNLTAGTNGDISVAGTVGAGTALDLLNIVSARAVTLNNTVTVLNTVSIANAGLLTIADATSANDTGTYDIIAPGGFTQSGTGAVNLQGDIRAGAVVGGISFAGPITLTGHVRLAVTVGTGGVSFANASTIDGDGVNPRDLFVSAASGNIAFGTASGLGNARIGGTNPLRAVSISTTGNATLYGGVDIDSLAAANALNISAGTIRFYNRVNIDAGNVSITNAGVLYTEEDADFTLTGASASFTQEAASVGACQLAGGITTAGGTITFNQDVYLVGTLGTMTFSRGAVDSPIAFNEDLYITADGKNVILQSAVRAANFVLFHGTVTLAASVAEPAIRTTSGDVVLYGAGYDPDDAALGVLNLFAYDPPGPLLLRPASPAIHTLPTTRPDGVDIDPPPLSYSGSIAASLGGTSISVFRNFYANGINLNPGAAWTLLIPDNDVATAAFAEVYNLTLGNCTVTPRTGSFARLAAAEATNGGGNNPNCVFTRPVILNNNPVLNTNDPLSGTYTISDDIIRVEFEDGLIENSNGEINDALANIQFYYNGTYTGFTSAWADAACTDSIDDDGDVSVFYLRTDPSIAVNPQRWNTDATGSSAGALESTDKGRSGAAPYTAAAPAHRDNIPCLDIPKALGTVFATLRDNAKNRIGHYHAGGLGPYTAVADRCAPVLAAAYTGQELHNEVQANQQPYDAHNFIEFRYSEAVTIGDFASRPNAPYWTIPYERTQAAFAVNTDWGGGITPWLTGIEISGYARIAAGSVVTGTRESFDESEPAAPAHDPTAQAIYRNFSVDGASAAADQSHRIRISIAGWCEETMIRSSYTTPYKAFWRGYIDSATTPSGQVTVLANSFIQDSAGNVLEPTNYITVNNTANNLYGPWDTARPAFAGLKSAADPWNGTPTLYEAVPAAAMSGFINRLEMHFFDNAVNYNNTDTYGWQSKTGWYTGIPGKIFLAQPQSVAPERFGGSRPIAAAQNTLGGIRDSSFLRAESAFTLQTGGGDTTTGNSYSTTVNSRFFNLTASLSVYDDPYVTIGIDEVATEWPIATTLLSVSYNGSAFITDLAGNRLNATPYLTCLDRSPPTVTLSLAGAGRNELYLLFSKGIDNWAAAPLTGITVNLDDGMGGTIPITPTAITAPDGNRGLLFTLPGAVTAEQLISPLSQITFSNANTVYDPDLGAWVPATYYADAQDNYVAVGETHRLTDIGIGLVDVLYGSDGVNANGVLGENVGALRNFDGTGRLLDRDITIATRVNLAGSAPGTLSLYFDVNPPPASLPSYFNTAAQVTSNLWLPSVLPSFNAQGNGAARLRSPEVILDPGQLLRNFLIPEADSEIVPGSRVDMVLRYGPLYCARLVDQTDIRSVAPWSFSISETKRQRGGVTILNNVIDSRRRERTILQVEVPRAGNIVIQIFTIDGNLLRVLERGRIGRGTYTYTWDGTNGAGNPVARGIYFIRVVGPDIDEIRKVMVVKE